ncbi:MAG TPA: nucleotidyltransferase family protein [Methylomirabilota bacterium]|nr:nucleotidyltransferase family protein [Methylomirabilota bacterium]
MSLTSGLILSPSASLREALEAITKNGRQAVFVTDDSGRLAGLVTDGDVRRGILRGASLDSLVADIMNARPVVGPAGLARDEAVALMQQRSIRHLPLLDAERRLVDILFLDELLRPPLLPNPAVIMAGGAGRRLAPLTETTPKPLLKVGGRPLIDIMIERLRAAGVREIVVVLHYKAAMIRDHLGDGARLGVSLGYHDEEQPRGTAGSLRDLGLTRPFLLVNADILTRCDFRAMLSFHDEHRADMTVGTVPYTVDLPYGVLEVDGARLAGVTEKPRLDFQINSGIYVITPAAVELAIPAGGVVDVPDVIATLTQLDKRVVAFPIREYWLDVGRHDDFHKADRDVAEGLLE